MAQNLYPFLDEKGAKTLPFGASRTYMAYIREYPTLPPPPLPREKVTKRRPEIRLSKQAKGFADKRQKTVQKRYRSRDMFHQIASI